MSKGEMWAERGWPEFATNMEINYDCPLSSSRNEEHNVYGGKDDCSNEKYGRGTFTTRRLLTRENEIHRRMLIDDEDNEDEDEVLRRMQIDDDDDEGNEDEDEVLVAKRG
ncbi:hypothetical protein ACLB2K_076555 [Fragaria x ananassa]